MKKLQLDYERRQRSAIEVGQQERLKRMELELEEEIKVSLARGSAILAEEDQQNFIFLYGCRPSAGVKANTTMIKDILNALINSADRINFTVLLPQALEQLKGNDASFETACSSSIQTVKLYYNLNVVTKSLGLVLYHNSLQ